jgi:hypothetical protein
MFTTDIGLWAFVMGLAFIVAAGCAYVLLVVAYLASWALADDRPRHGRAGVLSGDARPVSWAAIRRRHTRARAPVSSDARD